MALNDDIEVAGDTPAEARAAACWWTGWLRCAEGPEGWAESVGSAAAAVVRERQADWSARRLPDPVALDVVELVLGRILATAWRTRRGTAGREPGETRSTAVGLDEAVVRALAASGIVLTTDVRRSIPAPAGTVMRDGSVIAEGPVGDRHCIYERDPVQVREVLPLPADAVLAEVTEEASALGDVERHDAGPVRAVMVSDGGRRLRRTAVVALEADRCEVIVDSFALALSPIVPDPTRRIVTAVEMRAQLADLMRNAIVVTGARIPHLPVTLGPSVATGS